MAKDEGVVAFGREVRRRRMARGWTLDDLADVAGLTPNFIGGVENGRPAGPPTSCPPLVARQHTAPRRACGARGVARDARGPIGLTRTDVGVWMAAPHGHRRD